MLMAAHWSGWWSLKFGEAAAISSNKATMKFVVCKKHNIPPVKSTLIMRPLKERVPFYC